MTRCVKRRFRRPTPGNARATYFGQGVRLARDDLFRIADLPPEQAGRTLRLWGYVRTSPHDDLHVSDEPLSAMDQRPGSSTAGQRIFL